MVRSDDTDVNWIRASCNQDASSVFLFGGTGQPLNLYKAVRKLCSFLFYFRFFGTKKGFAWPGQSNSLAASAVFIFFLIIAKAI